MVVTTGPCTVIVVAGPGTVVVVVGPGTIVVTVEAGPVRSLSAGDGSGHSRIEHGGRRRAWNGAASSWLARVRFRRGAPARVTVTPLTVSVSGGYRVRAPPGAVRPGGPHHVVKRAANGALGNHPIEATPRR